MIQPKITFAASVPDGYSTYTVSTYSQFKSAITASSKIKKYIILNSDITYGFANGASYSTGGPTVESLYFTSDTIIDGSGSSGTENHKLLFGYTGKDGYYATTSPFRTITPNISVTYKNIIFGDTTHPVLTHSGFLYPYTNAGTSLNMNLTLENITMNITNNGSPLNSYYATDSTVTFKGTNKLSSASQANFSQGFKTIIFDSNSNTTIQFEGSDTYAVISGEILSSGSITDLTMTLNDSANVTMNMGNTKFVESSNFKLNVGNHASFSYTQVSGNVNKSQAIINSSTASTINVDTGGSVNFNSTNPSMTTWYFGGSSNTINANAPNAIIFSKSNGNGNLFSGSVSLNRTDSIADYNYQSSLVPYGSPTASAPTVYANGNSNVLPSTSTTGDNVFIYEPSVAVTANSYSTNVAANVSELNIGNEVTVSNNNVAIKTIEYKVAAYSLSLEGGSTSTKSQNAISAATTDKLISNSSFSEITGKTIKDLLAGNYFVYTRVSGTLPHTINGFSFTTSLVSKWLESTATVPKGIYVQFPDSATFKSSLIGNYESVHYPIINQGNTPISVQLSDWHTTNSQFDIVAEVNKNSSYETTLRLNLDSPLSQNVLSIDLSSATNSPSVLLGAYMNTDSKTGEFYFTGNYSGPLDSSRNSSYKLSFAVHS